MKKEILLIQPPLLHSDFNVDQIQKAYWRTLRQSINKLIAEISDGFQPVELESNFTGFIEPNIGLLYVAGSLRRAEFNLKYRDFHILDLQLRMGEGRIINESDIENALKKYSSKVIMISPLTVNFHWAVNIAETYKRLNPDSISILGGVHATFEYESILIDHRCFDYVAIGEGEISAVQLLDGLFNVKEISMVKGIAYRENGSVKFTGKPEQISDLDELAYPDYSLINKEYLKNCMLRVLTSRGCINKCSFCVPSSFFSNLRFRNYKKVVDEIEYLKNEYQARTFMIGDLNFLNDYEYAKKFCRELIDRDLKIFWMCQSRVDLISREIIGLMREAGCMMVCLGMESGSQDILSKSNKNITLERAVEACKIVKEAGLNLFTFWVFGLPGETHDSAFQTIKMLRHMLDRKLIDYTHCTVCVPYPGTAIYKDPGGYGIRILSGDFSKYWMGCDYLGADLPVMETVSLSRYEIYAYWQLALSIVAGNLNEAH